MECNMLYKKMSVANLNDCDLQNMVYCYSVLK